MLMRRNLKIMMLLMRKREDYDIYEQDNEEEKEERA
jgi:hypothetical protein